MLCVRARVIYFTHYLIFYVIHTMYADDTAPYAIKDDIESINGILQNDISIIIKLFQDNYFKSMQINVIY